MTTFDLHDQHILHTAITGALVANDGDSVLLCLNRQLKPEELKTWGENLAVRFPTLNFTIAAGVTAAIVHGEDGENPNAIKGGIVDFPKAGRT